jgi:hypothetical protein
VVTVRDSALEQLAHGPEMTLPTRRASVGRPPAVGARQQSGLEPEKGEAGPDESPPGDRAGKMMQTSGDRDQKAPLGGAVGPFGDPLAQDRASGGPEHVPAHQPQEDSGEDAGPAADPQLAQAGAAFGAAVGTLDAGAAAVAFLEGGGLLLGSVKH